MVSMTISEPEGTIVPIHPLGIKPSGNAFAADHDLKAAAGFFAWLPDELLLAVLEWLDPPSLVNVGGTCKALFAFASFDELWKSFIVRSGDSQPAWRGTWRQTWLTRLEKPVAPFFAPDCSELHSDLLHRPFFCASVPLGPFSTHIPSINNIPKMSEISEAEFVARWSSTPFVLTAPVKAWPIYRSWSLDWLVRQYGTIKFQAESVSWSLQSYVEYSRNNRDESPLYLFDKAFKSKMALTQDSYGPPKCFGTDLFNVLGNQRPDHAWLIIGPERGGSTFHKDPNSTSAWNAVIRGSKYWIMFPPDSPPPGVFVSQDQSEVTSPLSITEWLLAFHAEARVTPGCREGICEEGEILYVPAGWWHLVFNLQEGIALTQNFVPPQHLNSTLDFLKNNAEQVSGFPDNVRSPFQLFTQKMEASYPELLRKGMVQLERQTSKIGKRKWIAEDENGGHKKKQSVNFTFGFQDADDEGI